jgi:hypothetical protein
MTDDEFKKILTESKCISENFVERDVYFCFYEAMMTQIDEIDSERHVRMIFVEFLEAIARAAHKMSLPPSDVLEYYNEKIIFLV